MRPLPLVLGGCLAVAAWSSEAQAFHLLINSLGVASPLDTSFSIYGLATRPERCPCFQGALEASKLLWRSY